MTENHTAKTASGANIAGLILQSSLTVSAIIVLVRAVAMIKEMVVAFHFGTSGALDAYLIAFLLPSLAVNVFGASFHSALVPALVGNSDAGRDIDRGRFISACFTRYLGILIVLTLALAVVAPVFVAIAGRGFSPAFETTAARLIYLLLPVFFFGSLSIFFTAVLAAQKKFLMAAAVPVATSVTTVIFLAALVGRWGIDSLAIGVVVGFVVEAFILSMVVRATGLRLRLNWRQWSAETRAVFRHTGHIAGGAALMSGTTLIDQTMAAWLDEGAVAGLAYATRLTAVLLTIATALSTVSLPYFSELVHNRDWPTLRGTVRRLAGTVLLGSAVIVAGVVIFSEPIVALIFERGNFSELDTRTVALVQAVFVLQIPFYVLLHIGVRLLYAMNKGRMIIWISAAIFSANFLGNILFMQIWGVAGIALATVISYLIGAALILHHAWKLTK